MNEITIDDIRRILIECAGEAEEGGTDGDFLDREFADLGYDSLALMEASARLTADYGVRIPDEQLADLRTPREMIGVVNGAFPRAK